jgi:hypothetical protein
MLSLHDESYLEPLDLQLLLSCRVSLDFIVEAGGDDPSAHGQVTSIDLFQAATCEQARHLVEHESYGDLLQDDASLTPGEGIGGEADEERALGDVARKIVHAPVLFYIFHALAMDLYPRSRCKNRDI